jgi:hypothetical protein
VSSLRGANAKKRATVRFAPVDRESILFDMKALATLVVLAGVAAADARIGENLSLLEGRFGESHVLGADECDPRSVVYGFDKAGVSSLRQRGFEVFAVIDADRTCQEIVYVKTAGTSINSNELQGMLLSNSVGQVWQPVHLESRETIYVRTDKALAKLTAPNRLEIVSAMRASVRKLAPADS